MRQMVEIGHIDIDTEKSLLLSLLAMSREGQLESAFHIWVLETQTQLMISMCPKLSLNWL